MCRWLDTRLGCPAENRTTRQRLFFVDYGGQNPVKSYDAHLKWWDKSYGSALYDQRHKESSKKHQRRHEFFVKRMPAHPYRINPLIGLVTS